MTKTIFITGATDGIELEAAKGLAASGHTILLHGRNIDKLEAAKEAVGAGSEGFLADFTSLDAVRRMADAVKTGHDRIDILINNAGVLKAPDTVVNGVDIRLMVNALAPIVLTRALLPVIPTAGRVLNLSSAAQARVDLGALTSGQRLDPMAAYSQSKLALTIWTQEMARELPQGPAMIAVNPGSLLATNMVREGFGIAGNDISIGADILIELSLGDGYDAQSGAYWDNDAGRFGAPHDGARDPGHVAEVMRGLARLT